MEPERWKVVDELKVKVTNTGCMIQDARVSPSGHWIVTSRWSGQGEWGYDVIQTDPLNRQAGLFEAEFESHTTLASFSADETLIVGGCGNWLYGWWDPEDGGEFPAVGGKVLFGRVFVHRLPEHEVTWHELRMDFPAGWLPEDPWDDKWLGPLSPGDITVWGGGFRMQLPCGKVYEVEGPLPDVIVLDPPDAHA